MLCQHTCGTFEPVQRGTNEPVAVWCAPDVDIVKAGLYVIVKVFSVVGSFRHFVRLLLNGPNDKDDCEIEILKRSKQINHGFVFPDVDHSRQRGVVVRSVVFTTTMIARLMVHLPT